MHMVRGILIIERTEQR